MRTIRLKAPNFLGDEVVFTGVVRDLKRAAPEVLFEVNTTRPQIWINNPNIQRTVSTNDGGETESFEVHSRDYCPPWRQFNHTPVHYLHAYLEAVANKLSVSAKVTEFKGDVYPDCISETTELPERFWLVIPGCKPGVPVKGWGTKNYQDVIDAMRGRMNFVQVGSKSAWFPPLRGVLNRVGTTDISQLISLVHQAEGILCPITSLMHLAAAVPVDETRNKFALRPCVVLAGGREPVHYIAYPGHRVLSNVGALSCCLTGGCGQSRFSDGEHSGGCPYPTQLGSNTIPRCMSLIKPEHVVAAIESYYSGGLMELPRRIKRAQVVIRHLGEPAGGVDISGVEVGVRCGEMSAALLRSHSNLRLLMVDPWVTQSGFTYSTDPAFYGRQQTRFDREYQRALENTNFAKDRRIILKEFSVEAAKNAVDRSLDFAFIDACHSYEGCKSDLESWFPKLKPGGLLCGHDYHRPKYPLEGVKQAVDEFAREKGLDVVTDEDNTWLLRVPRA